MNEARKAVAAVKADDAIILDLRVTREVIRDRRGPCEVILKTALNRTTFDKHDEQEKEALMKEWLFHTANIRKLDAIAKVAEGMRKMYPL